MAFIVDCLTGATHASLDSSTSVRGLISARVEIKTIDKISHSAGIRGTDVVCVAGRDIRAFLTTRDWMQRTRVASATTDLVITCMNAGVASTITLNNTKCLHAKQVMLPGNDESGPVAAFELEFVSFASSSSDTLATHVILAAA